MEKLPTRREGFTQKVRISGNSVYLRTGEYEDGRLGEIFITMNKSGATIQSILNCFCISISMGLQMGITLEAYCDKFLYSKFEPNGVVQGHKQIAMVDSIIDYVFKDLAIHYLGRENLIQKK